MGSMPIAIWLFPAEGQHTVSTKMLHNITTHILTTVHTQRFYLLDSILFIDIISSRIRDNRIVGAGGLFDNVAD